MKTITAVISTLAVIGLGFLFGPQISHGLAIFFTGGAFILIPLVAVIGLVIWAMAAERVGGTVWLPTVTSLTSLQPNSGNLLTLCSTSLNAVQVRPQFLSPIGL